VRRGSCSGLVVAVVAGRSALQGISAVTYGPQFPLLCPLGAPARLASPPYVIASLGQAWLMYVGVVASTTIVQSTQHPTSCWGERSRASESTTMLTVVR